MRQLVCLDLPTVCGCSSLCSCQNASFHSLILHTMQQVLTNKQTYPHCWEAQVEQPLRGVASKGLGFADLAAWPQPLVGIV